MPSANVYNYGTMTTSTISPAGVVLYNAGTGTVTLSQPTCGDTTLPASYRDATQCDNSKAYNYCVRGAASISAAQQSQTWCQLDSGYSCSAPLPPMLLFGEAVSSDYNIIGAVSNNRGNVAGQPFVNRFATPSNKCYGPSNAITSANNNAMYYQMGVVGQDMCVRITCDGGGQDCANIQLSLLFTCYNPCNSCPADQTASCVAIAGSNNITLPTAQCTCKAGWSGATCSTVAPVSGGWSTWSTWYGTGACALRFHK